MKAYELQRFGLDHLRCVERPEPAPGPGQVLLAMRAVSLNYRDLLTVEGRYNPKQRLPLIPCSDGVGVVVAVGEGVTRVGTGERVAPIFAQRWIAGPPDRERLRSTLGGPLDGTLTERMVVDAEGVVRVPEHLSDVEAATLPCAAVTAWSALFGDGDLEPGQTVLTLGTGGVSLFALQIGVLAGARVIVTSSSDEKLERARRLGAWQGINYRSVPEWGRAARELTGGRGVDLVVEVGGAGTLEQSLNAVTMGGQISLIGNLAGLDAELSLAKIFMNRVRVQGILVGDRGRFEALNRAIATHRLTPVVDRVLPFEEAPEAFRALAAGGPFGKIAIGFS